MRQAIMTSPGQIELREVDAPKPAPGEVLLRIQRIGICGSDIHVNHGKHPYTNYPVVQGHEFSAIVEQIGEGVDRIPVGAKVTATPQEVCGKCASCQRGDYHICDNLKVQGFQAPGCAQDLFVTDAEKIILLPDSITFEQGAMVEPISVAVHAVQRAGDLKGKNVAVLGAGPIGNLVAQVVRCTAEKVLITDVSDYRLDVARQCGLAHTSNPEIESLAEASQRVFGDAGFQVAFECVGIQATIESAITEIKKGGTILVVGVFGEKPRVDLGLVQDRELSLVGTLMYQYQDFEKAVELIASGEVQTAPLESEHFKFEEYGKAYNYIDDKGDKSMKVFIDF